MTDSERFIACETPAAITTHVRRRSDAPVSYTGTRRSVRTLCGERSGWDLEFTSVDEVRCHSCRAAMMREED